MIDLLDNAQVSLGSGGSVSNRNINYYYETNFSKATLNPMCFYVDAGATLNVGLTDYTNYMFAVQQFACDESAANTDFSFTEGTCKYFGVATAGRIYNSTWCAKDLTLHIEEPGLVEIDFRNVSFSSLTAEDTETIKSLLTATVTVPK